MARDFFGLNTQRLKTIGAKYMILDRLSRVRRTIPGHGQLNNV
jgi:hypothetical protein